jgi:hypothetical protein
VASGHAPLLSREKFHRYSLAFEGLLSCSASSQGAAVCARIWVEQIADIGDMTEPQKRLGEQMTLYYATDVLRAHSDNSAFCTAKA